MPTPNPRLTILHTELWAVTDNLLQHSPWSRVKSDVIILYAVSNRKWDPDPCVHVLDIPKRALEKNKK